MELRTSPFCGGRRTFAPDYMQAVNLIGGMDMSSVGRRNVRTVEKASETRRAGTWSRQGRSAGFPAAPSVKGANTGPVTCAWWR
jgi:hypothetical protein